jgi:uncharacterized protein (UPF0332 family)
MAEHSDEISAYLERADSSLQAAKDIQDRYPDIAASRAYYAVFYASSALLLSEGIDSSKHSGVIAAVHRDFVRTGRLGKDFGKNLNWLFELRNIGDYGVAVHVSNDEAARAIQVAEGFMQEVKTLLKK